MSGAELWRFDAEIGSLVLRAWPEEFRDRSRLEQIDTWLVRASHLRFVPVPLGDMSGRKIIEHAGRLWQVSPWLPGTPDLSEPPAVERVEAAFRGLASFHLRLANDPASKMARSPGLMRRSAELDDLIRGGFDRLERCVLGATADRLSRPSLRWIELARSAVPGLAGPAREAAQRLLRLQPCIRDARRDHFLFQGIELTGIVDFGAMDVDCVAGDISRLIGDWLDEDPGGMLRRRALAAYEEITPLDPDASVLLPRFEEPAILLAPGHWIRWHFAEGRAFEDRDAAARGISRGLKKLERWIAGSGVRG